MSHEFSILIVDDDIGMTETLADILELKGYTTIKAHDGSQAIDIVRNQVVDLVLMDIKMPGMNGVDVLKELKKIDPTLKCIMMTAYSYDHLIQEAMALGALDVLSKPHDVNYMMGLISRCNKRADSSGA